MRGQWDAACPASKVVNLVLTFRLSCSVCLAMSDVQDNDQELSRLDQLFLHALIAKRVLKDVEAIALWKRCSQLLRGASQQCAMLCFGIRH